MGQWNLVLKIIIIQLTFAFSYAQNNKKTIDFSFNQASIKSAPSIEIFPQLKTIQPDSVFEIKIIIDDDGKFLRLDQTNNESVNLLLPWISAIKWNPAKLNNSTIISKLVLFVRKNPSTGRIEYSLSKKHPTHGQTSWVEIPFR